MRKSKKERLIKKLIEEREKLNPRLLVEKMEDFRYTIEYLKTGRLPANKTEKEIDDMDLLGLCLFDLPSVMLDYGVE